jgi:hypothetical protein
MNESAAFLWQKTDGQDFTEEDLIRYLTEEYEVDDATARADAKTLLERWHEAGIIED